MSREEVLRLIVEGFYQNKDGSSGTASLDKFLDEDEVYDWKLSYLANQFSEDYPEDHEDEPEWAKEFLLDYFKEDIEECIREYLMGDSQ